MEGNSSKVASDLSTEIRTLSRFRIVLVRELKWFRGEYSFLIACIQALCGMTFFVLLCLKLTMTVCFVLDHELLCCIYLQGIMES